MAKARPYAAEVAALQTRYIDFVDRLVARGDELVAQTLDQVRPLAAQPDQYETACRVVGAVDGQLRGLEAKAEEVYDQQIDDLDDRYGDNDLIEGVQAACEERAEHLSRLVKRWQLQLGRAVEPDREAEYRRIVAEFEATVGSYRCQQCGATLPVDRLFFIDVFITCPQCQTQNQYSPPASARSLEQIAVPLAMQRQVRFLDANRDIEDQMDALQRRWYEIRMLAEFGDRAAAAEMERLGEQMMGLLHQSDQNTQTYLAAVYTDVQAMVPDREAHYQTLQAEALRHHHKEVADETKSITRMLNEARRHRRGRDS